MITRKIGNLLRGASPYQILTATLLGSCLGFAPGFSQAPGWMALLIALLMVLNANLFVASATLVMAKLLYLAALPLLFNLGVWLLEGPARGLYAALANLPVLAWFGFEYYVVAAGIPVGIGVGLIFGIVMIRGMQAFRARMATAETQSAAFAKWSAKLWVRALAWLLFGGLKGKKSWTELAGAQRTLPIRPIGAVLVVLLAALLFIASLFLQEQILTAVTQTQLERVNRATVDIGSVNLLPAEGKLRIENLAMADRENLDQNVFSAGAIEANISGLSLLRRQFALDRIEISEGASGTERAYKGALIGPQPKPSKPIFAPGTFSIEEILANADVWISRVQQLADILERVAPDKADETAGEAAPSADGTDQPARPSWRESLELRAQTLGYANLATDSLATGAPTLLIREFVALPVTVRQLDGEAVDITAENLSTQPWLSTGAPVLQAKARSGKFALRLSASGLAAGDTGTNTLSLHYDDIAVDALAASMKDPQQLPFKGGSISIKGEGTWSTANLDLPLTVVIKDTTVTAFGKSTRVSSLEIPARIVGPLRQPRLSVSTEAFQQALKSAVGSVFRDLATDKLREATGGDADSIGSKLGGLLNFGKKDKEESEPQPPKEEP